MFVAAILVPLQLFIVASQSAGAAEPAAGAAVTADQEKFFESKVRPVLAQHCLKCHGPKKQRGELRVDSRAGLLKGGDSGPAIVPGNPVESLLIDAVNHASLVMPPEEKLSDVEIESLTEWVRIGAPWPDSQRTILAVPRTGRQLGDADRQWWSYRPVQKATPPSAPAGDKSRGPIDRFVAAKLAAEQLAPAPEASRREQLRRLTFDLLGLPPTAEQIDDFLSDEGPDAYERLVDRLLASPRHGERWAQHWLDLVRYAESDGFKQDDFRPTAWRYRDYVVRSFNADKPYDRFAKEQLAGDELAPGDAEALVATGYLRHWIYEYNQRDVRSQWHNILNDITDVTADVFLGVGIQCARCHDHKYDPVLQRDYYRLQAFFTPLMPRDDLPIASAEAIAEYHERLRDWESKTAEIRAEIAALEGPIRERTTQAAIDKFPKDIRPMLRKGKDGREPFEHQLAELAQRQVVMEHNNLKMDTKLKDEPKDRWKELQKRLAEYEQDKPAPLPTIQAATDVGAVAPPTYIQGTRGGAPIAPGFLSVLDPTDVTVQPAAGGASTGRRLALARWITSPTNPLTPRVMANRLWQFHFGRGLARSASDFGKLGEAPSHPELLDWLSATLVERNWSLKSLHRELVTSATYRQSATSPLAEQGKLKDPDNRWLWRASVRRLDAEQVRDSLLAATG
ncbi:MAG TPA: PSD1 and planctomycete cytochrome C domain-containing protein, partial [Pirellulaceae bacterium]|nr:PSD1 and planctomycete cytochrome C domain-containing protein [Pirellulaceae bacterium]